MKIFNLSKTYKLSKNQTAPALKGISFELPERGMVFILGRSGSGKSTLLNILSGLDGFDGGNVIFEGKSFKEFTDADRNAYRNGCCGFVFQEYNLIPELTVGETWRWRLNCRAKSMPKRAHGAHLQGELPRREGEAAITKYSAEVFEELGYLNGGKLAYCDREYTVTGIVDTHLDEAYEQLKTARTDTYSDLSSRFISDITYSAHNIIFIDEGTAQTIKQAVQEEYDGYYFRVLADIKNTLPEDFLDGESGYTVRNYIADKIAGMMPETDLIKNIAGALGGIMAVFSVAVMLNLMSQSASDKTLTLGVLKAFGASGRNLAAIFAVQSGLMALATLAVCTAATPALCAALNCALLGQYAAQGMAIFVFGALPVLALVAIAATFALLGCSLPALKTARMKSAEILRSL